MGTHSAEGNGAPRGMAELTALGSYVPEWLFSRAILDPGVLRPEAGVRLQAAVAFADIAGFTALAERLAATGREGAEELTVLLNQMYTALLEAAATQGGSVAHFGGDAMTVLFPAGGVPPRAPRRGSGALLAPAILRAVRGAAAMQTAFAPFRSVTTSAGVVDLNMEVGISAGGLLAGVVGRPEIGLEFVVAGRTVDRAAAAERNAPPGTIHLDTELIALVRDQVTFGLGATTSRPVLAVRPAPPAPRRLRLDGITLPEADSETLLAALRPFVPPGPGSPWPWGNTTGEHRRVTTAFLRFSGLDYDYDPQPLHKLQTYFTLVQETVTPFGGRVNRVLTGDKGSVLHLLFGAPVAHEDDAARALRAALTVLAQCPLPFPGEQCLGLATGPVFAGALGSTAQREYTVLGATVNRAARLTEIAAANQVLIDAATAERADPSFRLQALPPRELRGMGESIPVWSLEGETPAEIDPVLRHFGGAERPPLVGRDAELRQVEAIGRQVQEGQGQVLLITGDAGIGKTRLVEELLSRWLLAGGLVFAGSAHAYGAQRLYRPWIELLRNLCDLHPGLTAAQQRARLAARVNDLAPALADDLPLLEQILGVAAVETPDLAPGQADPPPHAAPGAGEEQFRGRRRIDLILALLRAEARRRPVLLLLDGLQWADPASLALVNVVARETLRLPILLCLEARLGPVRELPALDQPNARVITLQELALDARSELLSTLAARRGLMLSPPLAALIQERSQGNPFFMEELLAALEAGAAPLGAGEPEGQQRIGDPPEADIATLAPAPMSESHGGRRPGTGELRAVGRRPTGELHPPPALQVPDTIEGVLMARLDSLDDAARQVVRVAAVVGAIVPLAVLRGLIPDELSDADLAAILARLAEADLLRREPAAPDPDYRFKHNLTRQVAYESLAYAERRRLHGAAGALLERLYHPELSEHYDTLAYHYGLSERYEQGRTYLEKAGDRAAGLFVLAQAVQYYEQALAPGRWPELQQDVAAEAVEPLIMHQLVLHRKLARAQVRTGDYAGAAANLRQALAICPAPAWEARIVLYCELAWLYETQGNYIAALEVCRVAEAELLAQPPGLLTAQLRVRMGSVLFRRGDYADALIALHAALPVLESQTAQTDLAVAHNILGNISLMRADLAGARAEYEQSLGLYQAQDDLWGMANCYNNLGNVCWGAGQLAAAHDYYEQSLALREQMGDPGGAAMVYTGLASVYWQMGDIPEAHRCADMAIVLAEQVGRVECVVLAYIEKANLLETEGDFSAALGQYSHAHALAEQLGSLYLLGRTGLGMAQAHLRLGDHAAARTLLDAWAPQDGAQAELLQLWMFINAELALETEQEETAATILGELAATAERYGALYVWCATARLQGELALRQQDLAAAAAHASRARALAEQMPARVELARALDLLSRCYAADPALPGAVAPAALVTQAIGILEQCGPTRYLTPLRLRLEASPWPDAVPVHGMAPATTWDDLQWDEVEDYDF